MKLRKNFFSPWIEFIIIFINYQTRIFKGFNFTNFKLRLKSKKYFIYKIILKENMLFNCIPFKWCFSWQILWYRVCVCSILKVFSKERNFFKLGLKFFFEFGLNFFKLGSCCAFFLQLFFIPFDFIWFYSFF